MPRPMVAGPLLPAAALPFLVLGWSAGGAAHTARGHPPSWRTFAGTNYGGGAGMPDVVSADLGFVRDPLGPPWLFAEWPVVGVGASPSSAPPSLPNITAVKGPFSGRYVYMDFAGAARHLSAGHSEDAAAGVASALHVTALVGLGVPTLSKSSEVPSGADAPPAGWDMLVNHTRVWQDIVYAQVHGFNSANWRAGGRAPLLHWQLGNEINGCMFNAVAVLNTSDCTLGGAIWNSAMQRNAYADLFYAPTVEAIRRASADAYRLDACKSAPEYLWTG